MEHEMELMLFGKLHKFKGYRGTRGASYTSVLAKRETPKLYEVLVRAELTQNPFNDLWDLSIIGRGEVFKVEGLMSPQQCCTAMEPFIILKKRNILQVVEDLTG